MKIKVSKEIQEVCTLLQKLSGTEKTIATTLLVVGFLVPFPGTGPLTGALIIKYIQKKYWEKVSALVPDVQEEK